MPTVDELLDQVAKTPANEPQSTQGSTSGLSVDQLLDQAATKTRTRVPETRERGVLEEFGSAAIQPFIAAARAPSLLTMDDDELYDTIQREYTRQQTVQPAGGVSGTVARLAGGLAGGVGEFAGATALAGGESGPAAPFVGPGIAFAATGAWEGAMSAGVKALQQGKSKADVVAAARSLGKVGAATGAASAVAFGASGLIPRTASALARTTGTAAAGVAAGVGSQLAENIAEQKVGLEVSPTEGLLEQAIVMGLIPVLTHAKDLYRQARTAKDPAIAKTIQESADKVAKQELAKADVSQSDHPIAQKIKKWQETKADADWVKVLEGEMSEADKKAAEKQRAEQEAEFKKRKTAFNPKPRQGPPTPPEPQKPEVPGTMADQQVGAGQSVVDEVRSNELFTRADVQNHFRETGARVPSNEEAADLLRKAWRRTPEEPSAIDEVLSTYKETPQPEEPPATPAELIQKSVEEEPLQPREPRSEVEKRIIERHRQEAQQEFDAAVAAGDKPAIRTAQKRLMQILKVQQAPTAPAKSPITPKPEPQQLPRTSPAFKPEVPTTGAEPRETVIETIRKANARTKEEIRALFPNDESMTREKAAKLRDQAWGKQEVAQKKPELKTPPPEEPPAPAAEPVNPAPKPPAPAAPAAAKLPEGVTEADLATDTVEGAFKQYDETGEIQTVGDLADTLESIPDLPPELQSAIDEYRAAAREDMEELGGRGDADEYEGKLLDAVESHIKKAGSATGPTAGEVPTETKPPAEPAEPAGLPIAEGAKKLTDVQAKQLLKDLSDGKATKGREREVLENIRTLLNEKQKKKFAYEIRDVEMRYPSAEQREYYSPKRPSIEELQALHDQNLEGEAGTWAQMLLERSQAEDAGDTWSRSEQDRFEQLKDLAARRKSGDTKPQWNRWDVFTVTAPDGSKVQVDSRPWNEDYHNFQLRGPAISSTGFRSEIFQKPPEGTSIEQAAQDLVNRRYEERQAEIKKESRKKGKSNAIQRESKPVLPDVRTPSGGVVQEVPAEGSSEEAGARGSEGSRKEDAGAKPEVPGVLKLGNWTEDQWTYDYLKKATMMERANRARYLGLKDPKTGLVEVSAKKIADRAKQRLDEIRAAAAKPKAQPPIEAEPIAKAEAIKWLTPAIVTEDGQQLTGANHASIRSDAAKKGVDAITGAKEGFVDDHGNFVSRSDGAIWFKQKTGKSPATEGELHSEDLRDAGLLEHLPKESKETPPLATEAKPSVKEPTPAAAKKPKLTPMQEQYQKIKDGLPDKENTLLMYRLGDFYEFFFDDARKAAESLKLALTKRGEVQMAGVPFHAANDYIQRLLKAGYKVAVVDTPEGVKPGEMAERKVTHTFEPTPPTTSPAVAVDVKSVAEHLSPPVPDVTEQRARVRSVDVRQAELRDEQKKIEADIKALEPKVTIQRGPRYKRGRIKESAKASDLKQYRDLQKQLNDLYAQNRALDEAAKKDRAAIDEAINAEVISDPKKPLLRRLDRAVRAAQDKGTPPSALVDARDVETARVIREKYPDATKDEIARLAPQVQTGQYFYDDPWKDPNIPKLENLRRGALDAEVEKSGLFASFPEELQDKILRYSKAKRQYGEKPSPVDPVEDLSAKELAALRKEVSETTKKVVAENLAEAEREKEQVAADKAKEEQLIAEAQKVVDSAKRVGTKGGRSAKEVRAELVKRVTDSVNETMEQDPVTLTKQEDGSYVAKSESGGAFGEIEPTEKGKFSVSARPLSDVGRKAKDKQEVKTTVDTVQEGEWLIKGMASTGKGKTIIAIPGDGIWKLNRHGPTLLNVWNEARKLDVSKGTKPEIAKSKTIEGATEAAQTAVKLYGGAKEALERVENQMRILDADPETRYEGKQRERTEKMISLLRDWSRPKEETPKSAVPTGEGHTVEGARAEAEKAFGKLSDRVSFTHEPDNPSGAYTDRNKIVVNAAKVAPGTVEKVLLEEGLHGVWNEPSVQSAWKEFRMGVTEYEIAAERAKRKGLDTDRETLKEEAAISKLLANPNTPFAKRVWDAIIAALDRVFGVKATNNRDTLLEAARSFLREGGEPGREEFRFAAPTVGTTPIEQYTAAIKDIAGEKESIGDRVKKAFDVGERLSTAKTVVGRSIDGIRAIGDAMIQQWQGVDNIDELMREKGYLSKAAEQRGWLTRVWEKAAKRAVPRASRQAAIRKWIDAGGDMAELRRGAAETKPQFRQAYQDAQNLTPDELRVAQEARKYFESRLDEAIDADVLKEGVEDYIHRMYEHRPNQRERALAYVQSSILKTNPALAKRRVFQMDWEAEKEGFKPVQSFIPAIAEYETSLSRAIAARKFVARANELRDPEDNRPIVDIKGVGIPITDEEGERTGTLIKPQYNPAGSNEPNSPNFRGDYVTRDYPALQKWKWVASDTDGKPIFVQGDVSIHPKYVHRFDALLEPSRVRYGRYGSILRPALAISSAFKQTMLDLSGFHQVQEVLHGLEHKVNPFNLVQDIDFNDANVDGLLKGGLTIGGDYRYQREGLIGSSLIRQVPILGPLAETYHNWLFQDFIPRLKTTMALKALERNRERYAGRLSEEQIFKKTASQANSAFGGLNYTMLERSKTAQDLARLIMLAPDFLEARGRFAAEALARGGGKFFSNEQRSALLWGALTMYVAARALNKLTDDQYHFEPENAFSWVHNGQACGLRTVQGDILHLASKPLQFAMHRLNPVFGRTMLEAVTQRDEFGRKRSAAEIAWDTASGIIPISLRSGRERTLLESLYNAFGVTDRRWQDTDKAFDLARKWKDKHGVGERGEFIYDPDKDPLRPLKIALSRNDDVGAATQIKKLVDSKQYTVERLDQFFRRYRDLAFTGSKSNDRKFIAGLSEDQKKTVESAKQHKEQIARLYQRARGQYRQALSTQF